MARQEVFQYLLAFGFSENQINMILKDVYSIEENIQEKQNELIRIGYTKEEVLKITSQFPFIFSYHIQKISQRVEELMEFGYTKEQVLQMILALPALYGYDIDNIARKINFLKEIGLEKIILKHPKHLMQSVEVTYARYEFFKAIEREISSNSYIVLFMKEDQFQKQFRVTKEELLQKYNYEKYLEKKYVRTI